MERKQKEGVLLGHILRMAGWMHIEKKAKYLKGSKFEEENHNLGDVVFKKNNAGVLGSSKKLNPVWKGIWVITKIMSAVLLEIKNNKV